MTDESPATFVGAVDFVLRGKSELGMGAGRGGGRKRHVGRE